MSGRRWFIGDEGQTTLHILCGVVGATVHTLESDKMEFGFRSLQTKKIGLNNFQSGIVKIVKIINNNKNKSILFSNFVIKLKNITYFSILN